MTFFCRNLEDIVDSINKLTTYINNTMLAQLCMEGKGKVNHTKCDLVYQGEKDGSAASSS